MPKIGRPVENTPGDIRELIFGRYVVRYEIRGNDLLYILRIWHGKENRWPPDRTIYDITLLHSEFTSNIRLWFPDCHTRKNNGVVRAERAQPTDYLQKLQMVFHCFFGITLKQT